MYAEKLFELQNGDKYWKKHLTVFESRYTAGAQNKDFSAVSEMDLTRV